jgi:hypothetical protein
VNDFLTQLPALAGVVLGIIGTIIATFISDHGRWRRDQISRWDEKRLDAYSEYAKAVKDIHALTFRLTAHRMSANKNSPIGRRTGLGLLEQNVLVRTKTWETVLLLGDGPTVSAAREWWYAVAQLVDFARDSSKTDESREWLATVRAADEHRDRFYTAARQSLGIQGGSVAQAPWLPSTASWILPAPTIPNADRDGAGTRPMQGRA